MHLNREIKEYDLDMIYVSGLGYGGPAVVDNTYPGVTYSEIYPDINQDEAGCKNSLSNFPSRAEFPITHCAQLVQKEITVGTEQGRDIYYSNYVSRRIRRTRSGTGI